MDGLLAEWHKDMNQRHKKLWQQWPVIMFTNTWPVPCTDVGMQMRTLSKLQSRPQHISPPLMGKDTDLLILLLYYAGTNNKGLYFHSDKSKATQVYNMSEMKQNLDSDLCSQLLFNHAFTGCDTTSHIFSVGKQTALKKLVNGESTIQSCANVFLLPYQTRNVIEDHGTKAMAVLFGRKSTNSLASLRYNLSSKKIVNAKSFVTPERLPPTKSSPVFASYDQ